MKQRTGSFLNYNTESFPESLTYFPEKEDYHLGPEEYLEHIRTLKETVDIPVIASLNGVSTGGWIDYAKGCNRLERMRWN